jgi:hypothetical protein
MVYLNLHGEAAGKVGGDVWETVFGGLAEDDYLVLPKFAYDAFKALVDVGMGALSGPLLKRKRESQDISILDSGDTTRPSKKINTGVPKPPITAKSPDSAPQPLAHVPIIYTTPDVATDLSQYLHFLGSQHLTVNSISIISTPLLPQPSPWSLRNPYTTTPTTFPVVSPESQDR